MNMGNRFLQLIVCYASETEDGGIVATTTLAGYEVNTEDWSSGLTTGREEAELRQAMQTLKTNSVIYDLGEGTVFKLTAKGWNLADHLCNEES